MTASNTSAIKHNPIRWSRQLPGFCPAVLGRNALVTVAPTAPGPALYELVKKPENLVQDLYTCPITLQYWRIYSYQSNLYIFSGPELIIITKAGKIIYACAEF